MLMRISGGSEGIRDYLITGRKADRAFSRDELDTRVPLMGDLDFADHVINSMPGEGERYLHITLSFREDEVSTETMSSIMDDFKAFAFSAYDDDEYTCYAEAHLPRRTSYTDAKTGELIERKPHIHIVVPEVNLMTGQQLNPFGRVEHQTGFLEAFQEQTNAKYGLASPKDNRRTELTPASELISRYKGDVFKGVGHEIKTELLDAMLSRNVQTMAAFEGLLSNHGEIRTRNAGKSSEYRNVKLEGAAKGVNLKDYVFSKDFIELPTAEKRERLSREAATHYATAKERRATPAEYAAKVDEWHDRRALEVKYLNSGNRKYYAAYRAAEPDQQKAMLDERKAAFYSRWRPADEPMQEMPRDQGEPIRLQPNERPGQRDATQRRQLRSAHDLTFDEPPEAKTLDGLRKLSDCHEPATPKAIEPLTCQPNSVIERLTGELDEQRKTQSADREQLAKIRRDLDATQLLAQLSHSHGVIPEKYAITKGKDGGDRLQCGSRNLNVSDFLTKELNLPWSSAEAILHECYGRQKGNQTPQNRTQPSRGLWDQFHAERPKLRERRETAWGDQIETEKKRRHAIRVTFLAQRGKVQGDRSQKSAERKAAISVNRMERIAAEQALRGVIAKEREALKADNPTGIEAQYSAWLKQQAETGSTPALDELRRREHYSNKKREDETSHVATLQSESAASPVPYLPFRYEVSRIGEVTYSDHHGSLLRDGHDRISMLRTDDNAVAIGLKLASQKFYNSKHGTVTELTVNGSAEFKRQAVEVAVRDGIRVKFADKEMEAHRLNLEKQKQAARQNVARPPVEQKPTEKQKQPEKQPSKARKPNKGIEL